MGDEYCPCCHRKLGWSKPRTNWVITDKGKRALELIREERMNEHEHEVEIKRPTLALGYCQCGAEVKLATMARWREPRTAYGQQIRKLWQSRPVER